MSIALRASYQRISLTRTVNHAEVVMKLLKPVIFISNVHGELEGFLFISQVKVMCEILSIRHSNGL